MVKLVIPGWEWVNLVTLPFVVGIIVLIVKYRKWRKWRHFR